MDETRINNWIKSLSRSHYSMPTILSAAVVSWITSRLVVLLNSQLIEVFIASGSVEAAAIAANGSAY